MQKESELVLESPSKFALILKPAVKVPLFFLGLVLITFTILVGSVAALSSNATELDHQLTKAREKIANLKAEQVYQGESTCPVIEPVCPALEAAPYPTPAQASLTTPNSTQDSAERQAQTDELAKELSQLNSVSVSGGEPPKPRAINGGDPGGYGSVSGASRYHGPMKNKKLIITHAAP